jgi:magnesium-protoporphyrin O-methyltransferase
MQTNGNRTILKASFQGKGEARIELIDTPGIDEVDGEGRAELAKRIAQQADLILFIVAGDMTNPDLGPFDYAMAMDSLIYYTAPDIAAVLAKMAGTGGAQKVVFTVAPASPLLTLAWNAGRLFPRADRAPTMQPHRFSALQAACGGRLKRIDRISAGFYTSDCLEYRP